MYVGRLSRTNVDIDDEACAEVTRRYRLATKSEAVNLALRKLAAEAASLDEARQMRGGRLGGRPRCDALQPRTLTLVDTSAPMEILRNLGACGLAEELLAEEVADREVI